MKRFAVVMAAVAVLGTLAGPASVRAQDTGGSITVIDAFTSDYPTEPNPIALCVDGVGPQSMEVGDQFFVEEEPGEVVFTIYDNDAATCSDKPDETYTVTLRAGDRLGLVLGWSSIYTFAYDESCVGEGEARVQVASGLEIEVDVYLRSQATGATSPLALGLLPGSATTAEVPGGMYDALVVEPGGDPDGPFNAFVPNLELGEGTMTQLFLAGLAGDNDGEAGGFSFQQPGETCDAAEPPPEEATTSSTTSSTTTTVAEAPATAAAAAPVAGTPAYTG